jgi:hypothetical protein
MFHYVWKGYMTGLVDSLYDRFFKKCAERVRSDFLKKTCDDFYLTEDFFYKIYVALLTLFSQYYETVRLLWRMHLFS